MRIYITNIYVDDQKKALEFYTTILGFTKKNDIPIDNHSWLTVVSKDDPDGTELLLEPSTHYAVPPYKEALYRDKIPAASFQVKDLEKEYQRLIKSGVKFFQGPVLVGNINMAIFDDTCGNWIQMIQL